MKQFISTIGNESIVFKTSKKIDLILILTINIIVIGAIINIMPKGIESYKEIYVIITNILLGKTQTISFNKEYIYETITNHYSIIIGFFLLTILPGSIKSLFITFKEFIIETRTKEEGEKVYSKEFGIYINPKLQEYKKEKNKYRNYEVTVNSPDGQIEKGEFILWRKIIPQEIIDKDNIGLITKRTQEAIINNGGIERHYDHKHKKSIFPNDPLESYNNIDNNDIDEKEYKKQMKLLFIGIVIFIIVLFALDFII